MYAASLFCVIVDVFSSLFTPLSSQLNSDGSTLPYRTKATLFRNNPYDHWLGLEPPQNLKVNWEVRHYMYFVSDL